MSDLVMRRLVLLSRTPERGVIESWPHPSDGLPHLGEVVDVIMSDQPAGQLFTAIVENLAPARGCYRARLVNPPAVPKKEAG